MRYLFLFFIALGGLSNSFAQKIPEILSPKQVTALLTDSLKKVLNISFPVFRVYKYSDKSGQYYCALTESRDSIGADKDTFNHKIKAVNLKADKEGLSKVWEINDHIMKAENEENSIWFWTKYIDFKDFDKDSLVDPIIIYGTSAMNGDDDGRIKFLIYYKGQKIAIRHQNGIHSEELCQ